MRVPADEYRALPLTAHAVLQGVPLHDVSAVDLPDGGDRVIADVLSLLSDSAVRGGATAVLRGFRRALGRLFGWDRPQPAAASAFWDRVPADLRLPAGAS